MKKLAVLTFIAILLMACSKDQRAVRKLDGLWIITSWKIVNGPINKDNLADGSVSKMTFTNCNLKDDTYCDVIFTNENAEENYSQEIRYKVTNDATILEMTDDNDNSEGVLKYTISELDKSNLTLERTKGIFFSEKLKLEKQ